jgi:hypothetical protein
MDNDSLYQMHAQFVINNKIIKTNARCNHSCFEIDEEMDAILLIIGIVYGVCRIVIKSVQQCTYFLFSVNLLLVDVWKLVNSFDMMK